MADKAPTHDEVLDLMELDGGGFASALATAWRKADEPNSHLLFLAFGFGPNSLYGRYADRVAKRKQQEQK